MKSGILGNSISLYNPVFADQIVLSETHFVSGSDAISTDTVYQERCFVHVDITIKSAHYNTYHRNNPDKTFYPGDAFDYLVNTWTDGCHHFQPCPIQSTPNIVNISREHDCILHRHDRDGNSVGGTYGSASDLGT
jgi:hypothetical protein